MTAERHALNAALEYAAKQDAIIQSLAKTLHEQRQAILSLTQQLRDVRRAVDGLGDTDDAAEGQFRPDGCPLHAIDPNAL